MEAEGFGVFFDVVYFHVEDFLFVLVEKFAPRVCVDDLVEWGVVEFVLLVVGEERVCLGHYFILIIFFINFGLKHIKIG